MTLVAICCSWLLDGVEAPWGALAFRSDSTLESRALFETPV
jgi:hypothetical protein